jgi:hypothetical protein
LLIPRFCSDNRCPIGAATLAFTNHRGRGRESAADLARAQKSSPQTHVCRHAPLHSIPHLHPIAKFGIESFSPCSGSQACASFGNAMQPGAVAKEYYGIK